MFRLSEDVTPIKLDVKDKKLLVLLSENARRPISELSKKLQLARDTVAYRIKGLENLGAIQGFYPIIDFTRLGYNKYRVFLLVDETDKEKQQELISDLKNNPNTRHVILYSDRWDIEWTLIAKDIEEFDSIVTDVLGKFSSIII